MAATYKCTLTGCYDVNSPETHQLILRLQNTLNRFSSIAIMSFQPIGADGIVGKGTLSAALLVLAGIAASGSEAAFAPFLAPADAFYQQINTTEDVMVNLAPLVEFLEGTANALGLGMVAASSSTRPASVTPTSPGSAALLTHINSLKPGTSASLIDVWVNLPTWGKAGVVIGGLGGIALLLTSKASKKRKHALAQ